MKAFQWVGAPIKLSANDYSLDLPITGDNRIHLMGVPTSEMDSTPLSCWTEARMIKIPYLESLEICTCYAYIIFCDLIILPLECYNRFYTQPLLHPSSLTSQQYIILIVNTE
jgi:hypothetical protein